MKPDSHIAGVSDTVDVLIRLVLRGIGRGRRAVNAVIGNRDKIVTREWVGPPRHLHIRPGIAGRPAGRYQDLLIDGREAICQGSGVNAVGRPAAGSGPV